MGEIFADKNGRMECELGRRRGIGERRAAEEEQVERGRLGSMSA